MGKKIYLTLGHISHVKFLCVGMLGNFFLVMACACICMHST